MHGTHHPPPVLPRALLSPAHVPVVMGWWIKPLGDTLPLSCSFSPLPPHVSSPPSFFLPTVDATKSSAWRVSLPFRDRRPRGRGRDGGFPGWKKRKGCGARKCYFFGRAEPLTGHAGRENPPWANYKGRAYLEKLSPIAFVPHSVWGGRQEGGWWGVVFFFLEPCCCCLSCLRCADL